MNNTLKYTVVAAIIIVAAAFGIQSFISKSSMQNVDVSTLSPAAGEPSEEATAPATGMEPPAMESGTAAPAVDSAAAPAAAEVMPPQPEPAPMAGDAAAQPDEKAKEPATAPSFEGEKAEGSDVEGAAESAEHE